MMIVGVAKEGSPAPTEAKRSRTLPGGRSQAIMTSDPNLDCRVPLRVSNQKAYVWNVEGTLIFHLIRFEANLLREG